MSEVPIDWGGLPECKNIPPMPKVEPPKKEEDLEAKIQKMETMVKAEAWQQLKEFVCG